MSILIRITYTESCAIFSDNIDLIDSIDLSLRCSNVQFRIWQLPGGAFKSEISGKMTLSDISLQRHNQINRQHDRPAATRIQIYVNHDTLHRYLSRFFDQVGHQTMSAYIENKHIFTKSCQHQTYQNSKISWQKCAQFYQF